MFSSHIYIQLRDTGVLLMPWDSRRTEKPYLTNVKIVLMKWTFYQELFIVEELTFSQVHCKSIDRDLTQGSFYLCFQ